MPDLLIKWDPPASTDDIDSIVVYKKQDGVDCQDTLNGDLIYETSDYTSAGSRYVDTNIAEGTWRYAAFSKNEAGLSPCATDTYTVTANINQDPVVSNPLPDVSAQDNDDDMTIDLSNVFTDPEGDQMTLTTQSDNPTIVLPSINGNNLVLAFTSGQAGNATITVTAESNGATVSDQFSVTVTAVPASAPTLYYQNLWASPQSSGSGNGHTLNFTITTNPNYEQENSETIFTGAYGEEIDVSASCSNIFITATVTETLPGPPNWQVFSLSIDTSAATPPTSGSVTVTATSRLNGASTSFSFTVNVVV